MKTNSPKKLKIGIDIDNVLTDSYSQVLKEFNQAFATRVCFDQVFDFYYLEKYAGIEERKAKQFIKDMIHSEQFHQRLVPYKEAVEVVKSWSKQGFLLHYISARHSTTKIVTQKWLEKHGFLVTQAQLFLQDYGLFSEVTLFKKNVIEKLGIEVLIEDSKEVASVVDIPVFLFDRPWNQGKLPKNVKRIYNWQELPPLG